MLEITRNEVINRYDPDSNDLTLRTIEAAAINEDAQTGASLAVEAGIVAKEPIAQKAIPACNITCIRGEEMKQALSGYLEVLFEQNPDAVGGTLPGEDFYYIP